MQGARATISKDGPRDSANRPAGRSGLGKSADTSPKSSARPLPGTAICMALVALAMLLGGGGTSNPQNEMILQVLTALLVIPLVASRGLQVGLGPTHRAAWLLAGLVLLLPTLQLIPLPPSVWHALPGRMIEVQSLAVVQADQRWMPLSMAPARTFASLLAMICPVLVLLQISRLSIKGRNWICVTILTIGVMSLLLGVLQLSHTGGWDWSLYQQFSKGFLVGFQGNRNAEADVLLIVMLALGVLVTARIADKQHHALTWVGLAIGLLAFAVGLFLTGSRTGISLGFLALIFLAAMLWPTLRNPKAAFRWLAAAVGISIAAGALLSQLQSVQKVIARFSFANEARWDLWEDTWHAIQQVWPYGSGIGTIVPMLEAAERLEVVDTTRPVRAHNDWLEWVLEGGLPGIIILTVIILVIGVLVVRALIATARSDASPVRRAQVIFACAILLIESFHGIVDYPTRAMSLAVLIAVAVGFLLDAAATQHSSQ